MKKLILLTLIVILTACSINPPASEIQTNKTKWENAKIAHYRYNLSISCFCAFMDDMPLSIEVENGALISITTKNGTIVDSSSAFYEMYLPYSTIDRIFLNLEADLAGKADEVAVTYDPAYGYPTSISIDRIKEAVDDEVSYFVTDFEIIK